MAISRDDAISVLGPVDDELLADILATGASIEELVQARTWLAAGEAMMGEGRSLPSGQVRVLIDLLTDEDDGENGVAPADDVRP